MPRISIYVSDEMKARIGKAGERANWSAVAQRAFDVELNHLETVKEIGSMTDVIERLRASKAKFVEQALVDGRICGAEWAKRRAEYDELRRIAEFNEDGLDQLPGTDAAVRLYKLVIDEADPGNDALAAFFMIDEEAMSGITPEFVEGFVEGARDVWEEVSDEL